MKAVPRAKGIKERLPLPESRKTGKKVTAMRSSDAGKAKRIAAGIISLMMLIIVVLSAAYITAEAGHDCTGECCPICAGIRNCENTLRQAGDSIPLQTAAIVPVLFSFLSVSAVASILLHETPVSRKVRLNN